MDARFVPVISLRYDKNGGCPYGQPLFLCGKVINISAFFKKVWKNVFGNLSTKKKVVFCRNMQKYRENTFIQRCINAFFSKMWIGRGCPENRQNIVDNFNTSGNHFHAKTCVFSGKTVKKGKNLWITLKNSKQLHKKRKQKFCG